ncbi:hypothetical protein BDFB_003224 [Asbolus verrucosus]|uniref:NodB homology domain-containing protein n=1 Tax=Asbolus verrucosus TaxID=1661398 RepID=A0A482VTR2_ASBVE|nr:hypothetical protein BDFB_003224 [Asbolus verrucosus]
MLRIALLSTLVVTCLTAPQDSQIQQQQVQAAAAAACDSTNCVLPNCKCSSTSPPEGIPIEQLPQFVFLTFDDAIQALNYETYSALFYNRTNPDSCPVSATFFMAHEYTDYSKVHDLYVHNQEIALHSISHEPLTDYWREISTDNLTLEFGGEKTIISKFANIPAEAILGMRIPFLQLSGDNSFQVTKDIGLSYDCSWPTQNFVKPGLWPYTLDYASNQDCPIGPCPKSSIPGVWVFPMIDWRDQANVVCSMVDACVNIPDDVDGLTQWFIDNFNMQYQGNKAPFGFYVHAAYFNANPIHLDAYKKFVDYLQTLPDVYIVSIGKALQWIRHPVPIGSGEWPACPQVEDLGCSVSACELAKGEETRYMTVCGDCPDVYPWINNPTGEAL